MTIRTSKKNTLCLDNDGPGRAAGEKIGAKIGAKYGALVGAITARMPPAGKDWSEYLQTRHL